MFIKIVPKLCLPAGPNRCHLSDMAKKAAIRLQDNEPLLWQMKMYKHELTLI